MASCHLKAADKCYHAVLARLFQHHAYPSLPSLPVCTLPGFEVRMHVEPQLVPPRILSLATQICFPERDGGRQYRIGSGEYTDIS